MAKTLRTSGDYTIKTGTGAAGTNNVVIDSKMTRVLGDFTVDGTRTELNTTSQTVEDPFMILNRNNSGTDIDSGIVMERGEALQDAVFYWNEGEDVFKAITTATDTRVSNAIADSSLAKIHAATPGGGDSSNQVATKSYVDSAGGAVLTGSTNNQVTTVTGANAIIGEANLTFDGSNLGVTGSITVAGQSDVDYVRIKDNAITTNASDADLEISANGSGNVVINGINFLTSGQMISKSKATALAIALG